MAIGYKLFRQSKDGNLHPLFVNANQILPIGEWLSAECGERLENGKVKSRLGGLAFRPGWHLNDKIPYVDHIYTVHEGAKYLKDNCVWAEVEYNEKSYQTEANNAGLNKKGIIIQKNAQLDYVPVGGYYKYKTNPTMFDAWIISGEIRIIRIVPDAEVEEICSKAGLTALKRYHG